MSKFDLNKFMAGHPAQTRDHQSPAVFIAVLLDENIPAPLVVSTADGMTNYFMDGSYLGVEYEHEKDLLMAGYFD